MLEDFCRMNGSSFERINAWEATKLTGKLYERIQTMAVKMVLNKDLPQYLFEDAMLSAGKLYNRIQQRPGSTKTPFELWHGKSPNLNYLRFFGQKCYILEKQNEQESVQGILLGYTENFNEFKVFNLNTRKTQKTMEVSFGNHNTSYTIHEEDDVILPRMSQTNMTPVDLEFLMETKGSTDVISLLD